jgi:tRNA 2-thiouridine synthesizing protein A
MNSTGKKTVDARGLFCPGPIDVLLQVVKHIESGGLLELLADDPIAKQDITAWCQATGNLLLSTEENGGTITFLIQKK